MSISLTTNNINPFIKNTNAVLVNAITLYGIEKSGNGIEIIRLGEKILTRLPQYSPEFTSIGEVDASW